MPPQVLIENVKHRVFLQAFHKFLQGERAEVNLLFLQDRSNNETIYQQYVRPDAPRAVNLPDKLRAPLVALAQQKQWSAMSAGLKAARRHIAAGANADGLPRFLASPAGQWSAFLLATGVDGSKAQTMEALFKVFKNGRTPQDKQEAYAAMLKMTNKALLNPALRALGVEPPPPQLRPLGDPRKALQRLGVKGAQAAQMSKLLADYARAASKTQRATLLDQMETVAQGSVKQDAIIAALKTSGLYRED